MPFWSRLLGDRPVRRAEVSSPRRRGKKAPQAVALTTKPVVLCGNSPDLFQDFFNRRERPGELGEIIV
jgi:hypothetical protein